jgi:hypothetical protein
LPEIQTASRPVSAKAQPVPIRSESESLLARVKKCFGALENLDADAVANSFAMGATLVLPGLAPISGRSAIRRTLIQFLLHADDLRHSPVQLWTAGNVSVFEADVTLKLADHTDLAFPVTYILRWADGMIQEARVCVYLESRMAVAISAFDRLWNTGCELRRRA